MTCQLLATRENLGWRVSSSPPSAAYMRQWTWSALVHVMAWRLLRQAITWTIAGFLSIGVLGTNFSDIPIHFFRFHSRNAFEIVLFQNGDHFVQGDELTRYVSSVSSLSSQCSLIIRTGYWVQILAWSSIAQSFYQRAFCLLEIRL